jgi:hypothetical protein
MGGFRISREFSVAIAVSVGLHAVWLVREAKASSARVSEISEVSLETLAPRPQVPESKPEEPAAAASAAPRAAMTVRSEPTSDRLRSATAAVPAWDFSRLFPRDADAGDHATHTALDRMGNPVAATTLPILVRFSR